MILLRGEWRKGKVRPVPGNAPHDRPVSRGLYRPKAFATIPFAALDSRSFQEHAGAHGLRFWRPGGIYRSDVAPKPNPSRDRLPPACRPRPRSKNASGGPRSSHRRR